MAAVHTEALRRIGVDVVGMVGSTPERTRSKANPLLPAAVRLARRIARRRRPRRRAHHQPQRRPRRAGQGGDRRRQARRLREAARRRRRRDRRARRPRRRRRGRQRGVLQPPPLPAQPARRRPRRAAAAIGAAAPRQRPLPAGLAAPRHGLELAPRRRAPGQRCAPSPTSARTGSTSSSSSAGSAIVEVCADLHTFITERRRPAGEVETFAAARVGADVPRVREHMESDDAAGLLLRFDGGARGVCTISQVSAGRRNRLAWEIDGDDLGAGVGVRRSRPPVDRPPRPPQRDRREGPGVAVARRGARRTAFPGGHVEGYPDTFRALLTAVYADIADGAPSASPLPDVRRRSRHRRRVRRHRASAQLARGRRSIDREIERGGSTHETRIAHGGVSRHAAHRGRRLGGRQRVLDARGRLLAARRRAVAALRRRVAHRLRGARRRRGQGARRRPRRAGHRDLRARLLPEPADARPRPPRRGDRPPAHGHRGGRQARRAGRQHVHRQRQGPPTDGELRRVHRRCGPTSSATPPTTA